MVSIAEIADPAGFRDAVRQWLPMALRDDPARGNEPFDPIARQKWWMSTLNTQGLGTPHWPRDYGGVGMDLTRRAILAEELARADSPPLDLFMVSLNHVPETLLHWGTEEQKKRYLPQVAKGAVWCQGFSEPGAGSDLASLSTRAELRGDEYVINGQKIWSSVSMYADHIILLARTGPREPKHAGISFFLLDTDMCGIEIRPIRQMNGEAKFGEIFLTDVRVPVENRVGEENAGWMIAQTTLAAERGLFALEQSERLRFAMEKFHRQALETNAPWLADVRLDRRFMELFAQMQAVRVLIRKLLVADEGSEAASFLPLHIKVLASELRRDFGDFLLEATGVESQFQDPDRIPDLGDAEYTYLTAFSSLIGGGTNEIMRNVVAERQLGMPRR